MLWEIENFKWVAKVTPIKDDMKMMSNIKQV